MVLSYNIQGKGPSLGTAKLREGSLPAKPRCLERHGEDVDEVPGGEHHQQLVEERAADLGPRQQEDGRDVAQGAWKIFQCRKNICRLLVTGDAQRELHHAIEQPVGEDEVVELRLARHLGADQAGVVIAAIVGVPGHHCLDIWIQIS